jgi:hypothetical protein
MEGIRRFRALLLMGAVVTMLGLALPAGASISGFTIDTTAVLEPSGNVTLSGTITCTTGEDFQVQPLKVSQPGSFANGGSVKGDCTDASQTWVVTTKKVSGTLSAGDAQACVRVRTFAPGSPVVEEQKVCQKVTLA